MSVLFGLGWFLYTFVRVFRLEHDTVVQWLIWATQEAFIQSVAFVGLLLLGFVEFWIFAAWLFS